MGLGTYIHTQTVQHMRISNKYKRKQHNVVNIRSIDLHLWNVNVPQNVESSRTEIRAFCLWMDRKNIMYLAICVDCLVKLGKMYLHWI